MFTTSASVALTPERHWACPNCQVTSMTRDARPHTQFHTCRGLLGITAPLVEDGTRCKIEIARREDYVGADVPHLDGEGRPVMSVNTTRDDGTDCAVLAPTATAHVTPDEFEILRRRLLAPLGGA